MRKIINKNRYNTETARKLGSWSNNQGFTDTLYVTKSGNYFRHYSSSSEKPPEDIEALIYDDARAWADKHLTSDEYKALFSGMSAPVKTIPGTVEKLAITLPSEMVKQLREKKDLTGATVSALVKKALIDAGYYP